MFSQTETEPLGLVLSLSLLRRRRLTVGSEGHIQTPTILRDPVLLLIFFASSAHTRRHRSMTLGEGGQAACDAPPLHSLQGTTTAKPAFKFEDSDDGTRGSTLRRACQWALRIHASNECECECESGELDGWGRSPAACVCLRVSTTSSSVVRGSTQTHLHWARDPQTRQTLAVGVLGRRSVATCEQLSRRQRERPRNPRFDPRPPRLRLRLASPSSQEDKRLEHGKRRRQGT